jgi:hypothetical protein
MSGIFARNGGRANIGALPAAGDDEGDACRTRATS